MLIGRVGKDINEIEIEIKVKGLKLEGYWNRFQRLLDILRFINSYALL